MNHPSSPPRTVSAPAALILIILVGLAAFGRVSRFEFTTWDDDDTVAHNPLLNPPLAASLITFWTQPQMDLYIPVTYTVWSLAANASKPQPPPGASEAPPTGTAFTPDPRVFHTLNLALHLLAAWLVFLLVRELIRSDLPALIGSLLFLVHPMQVEAVAWVSGMKDVLFATLSLLALWQYVRLARMTERASGDLSMPDAELPPTPSEWWGRYLFATLAFILAMLSKPTAMVVPALALALDLLVLRRPMRRAMLWLWPWFVLAIPCAIVTRLAQPTIESHVAAWRTPILQRPLVALDALAFYLYKLVWPAVLSFDYGRTPQRVAAQGWRGLAWLVSVVVAILLIAIYRRARLIVAAALVSLFVLLPVLGLVPFEFQAYSTVADHYFYLAMLGPAVALAWLLARRPHPAAFAVASVVLVALAARTFNQIPHWRSSQALFEHARQVNPSSYASFNGLAAMAVDAHDYAAAVQLASVAIQLDPTNFAAHMTRSGAFARLRDMDNALADCRKALDLAPANPQALGNFAALLANRGQFAEALPYAQRAVDSDPRSVIAHLNLARLYARLGDEAHAKQELGWIMEHDPDNPAIPGLQADLESLFRPPTPQSAPLLP